MSPSRFTTRIGLLLACLCLLTFSASKAQSTGFVHFRTFMPTDPPFTDLGVSRTFAQGANGPTEIFTEEFSPGPHTLARVETTLGICRAASGTVNFTVKAGQWVDVDVPVTFQDCSIGIVGYGDGVVDVFAGGVGFASCHTAYDNAGNTIWVNFHACQGTGPYGALVTSTATPFGNDCCSDNGSFILDTTQFTASWSIGFTDTSGTQHPQPSGFTDLSLSLVGGTFGGQVSNSIFHLVNHGPHDALQVQVDIQGDSAENDQDNFESRMSIADGHCLGARCFLEILPAGESTTVVVRYNGAPLLPGDTTAANIPGLTPSCIAVTAGSVPYPNSNDPFPPDPNFSNNTAACILGTPVTVTLGGATPPNTTVAAGTSNVPMLEFLLNPATQQTVNSVTLQAQGTGNEVVDVTAVNLYDDTNANGRVDAGEQLLATGTFPSNNGTVTLSLAPPLAISTPTNLLVTYSFNVTIVQRLGGGVALALLPFCFIPVVRRRRGWVVGVLALVMGVGLSSCGGDKSTGPGSTTSTYQVKLTGLDITGATQSNLSVTGATISIAK
ncbi:MAG: hypothetical protein ABJD11_16970 [Gemmatimonadota bacterium]